VALDGTADDEKIKFLVDMSYELTKRSKQLVFPFLMHYNKPIYLKVRE